MKVSVAALSILVVMAFSSLASSAPMGSNTPTSCCFSYVSQQIPRKFVTDYYETSSLCSQSAVVFKTKKGRQMCANPSDDWVQKYMADPELN
ncbi:C-C motif chemokine 4-like [Vombatus ursinus]|uniref:C-C motif chemokine n=1 Tax=Vombatus ursinus TaxID=29139 RepID=A0A4X2KY32_VOMUR|nr:C-C motif chemokine 4-like [Vombatus ursinus]XP_027717991.1 C-C motif chemokine 4-like [Vombatus ursinus]